MPLEYWRWELARSFGWPLEYIDGLSLLDLFEYWQIEDGINKAASDRRAHAQALQQRRGMMRRG
jgi:hypothetical protein